MKLLTLESSDAVTYFKSLSKTDCPISCTHVSGQVPYTFLRHEMYDVGIEVSSISVYLSVHTTALSAVREHLVSTVSKGYVLS